MWLQKQKTKKITWEGGLPCARAIAHDKDQGLPRAMTIAHGKPACQAACAKPWKGVCRVPTPGTRQTLRLCRVPAWWHTTNPLFWEKQKNSL